MRELRPAIIMTLLFFVFTGGVFPFVIWGVAQVAFPDQANGSFIRSSDGTIVGSSLIGQSFSEARYFHPRPSAAGAGYDAANSSGSNWGPINSKLIQSLSELGHAYREENGLSSETLLPADAVTRSGSGLDPHISPRNAELQAKRVAQARALPLERVKKVLRDNVESRFLGVWGEPRINVLRLNLALDNLKGE